MSQQLNELESRIQEIENRLLRLEEENNILTTSLIDCAKFTSQIKENEKLISDVSEQQMEEDCVNCKNIASSEDCF